MKRVKVSEKYRQKIEKRANYRCEYCLTTMQSSTSRFEIEHILPLSKGGKTSSENLALACRGCNACKYNKIEGIDFLTKDVFPLFNPRVDNWIDHFMWDKNPLYLIGLTAKGRVSIEALQLNRQQLINVRRILTMAYLHPPT